VNSGHPPRRSETPWDWAIAFHRDYRPAPHEVFRRLGGCASCQQGKPQHRRRRTSKNGMPIHVSSPSIIQIAIGRRWPPKMNCCNYLLADGITAALAPGDFGTSRWQLSENSRRFPANPEGRDAAIVFLQRGRRLLTGCCRAHRGWMSAAGESRHRSAERVDRSCPTAVTGALYWITSSAVASSVSGTARPRAWAVLALMTSSNLIGC
jgi:hypothetical protein